MVITAVNYERAFWEGRWGKLLRNVSMALGKGRDWSHFAVPANGKNESTQ